MMRQLITWIILTLCSIGIYYSISLIIRGSKPCTSDGCLIRFLLLGGIVVLSISGSIFLYILIKSIKSKLKPKVQ